MIPTHLLSHPKYEHYLLQAKKAGVESDYFDSDLGPYRLQHNLRELAALMVFLEEWGPIGNYLEIGLGAAGFVRFLFEQRGWQYAALLDDGRQFRGPAEENLRHIGPHDVCWADSQSEVAVQFLRGLDVTYDLIFIDADPKYSSVQQDFQLILPYCRKDTLVLFHNIREAPDVAENDPHDGGPTRFWREEPRLRHVLEIVDDSVPCLGEYYLGFGIAEVIK